MCVYCGASAGADPAYADAAERLGQLIAEFGIRLVYGGGSVGLMGILARAVLAHGGAVTGIMPQFLRDREVMATGLTETVVRARTCTAKRRDVRALRGFYRPSRRGRYLEERFGRWWPGVQLGRHASHWSLPMSRATWTPLAGMIGHMDAQADPQAVPRRCRAAAVRDHRDEVETVFAEIDNAQAEAEAVSSPPNRACS